MPPPRLSFLLPLRFKTISATPFLFSLHPALRPTYQPATTTSTTRAFTSTPQPQNWLLPKRNRRSFKTRKGRPHVPTGGSVRGTTVVWGDYGLRLRSHDQRISAAQFKNGEDVIRRRLRGEHYRLFTRICCNVAVYKKGNESRMGTGKGSFDHWAARVGPARVVFELSSAAHEQVVRDAFRLAGNKLPGQWEFVKKGDPPVMGITKLGDGVTEESLRRPRKPVPSPPPSVPAAAAAAAAVAAAAVPEISSTAAPPAS